MADRETTFTLNNLEQAIIDVEAFYLVDRNSYYITWPNYPNGGLLCSFLYFIGKLDIIKFEKVYDGEYELSFSDSIRN